MLALGSSTAHGSKGSKKGQGQRMPELVSLNPRKDLRCYDVLGVSRFVTPTEIRHAYRHKALSYHPDKSGGQFSSFLALAEAFEVLSDAAQRGAYDRELASANSRDGLSGIEVPLVASTNMHRDSMILCLALLELSTEEWPKHMCDVPTGTLKEMYDLLVESSQKGCGVRYARQEGDGIFPELEEGVDVKPRHLWFGTQKRRGYFCAQIQMCGIHIRTFSTRNLVTAAENHLALVCLKETFFAKWKENGMADFDEVLRAAAVESKSQKMFYPDAMHWFEKAVEPEPGLKWRLTTPCTRDLDSTLVNRAEVLALLNRGAPKTTLQKAIDKMRETEKSLKATRDLLRPHVEERLLGFIACELEHRHQGGNCAPRKRLRLRGKQSMTQLCVQLPWFGRFAAEQGISSSELEALLPPLQTRLRGVPSLEQCLQRALRNSLFASGQPPALEDLGRVNVGGVGGTKRKATQAIALSNQPDSAQRQRREPVQLPQQPPQPPEEGRADGGGKAQGLPGMSEQQQLALMSQQAAPRQAKERVEKLEKMELSPQEPRGPQSSSMKVQRPPPMPQPRVDRVRETSPGPAEKSAGPLPPQNSMREEGKMGMAPLPREVVPGEGKMPLPPMAAGPGDGKMGLPPPMPPSDGKMPLPPPQPQPSGAKTESAAVAAADSLVSADGSARSSSHGVGREVSPGRTREVSPVPRGSQAKGGRQRKGWRECYSFILQELLADPEVDRLFGQPVDLEMYPDYLERIAPNTPVDLRLILQKLGQEENGYADVDECSDDVSMVWENAARFNAPGSYVRAIAEQAAKIINDLLLGRRSVGRIWCRAPSQGHRSSLRPETRSRSETRSLGRSSQLPVQYGHEASGSIPKNPPVSESRLVDAGH